MRSGRSGRLRRTPRSARRRAASALVALVALYLLLAYLLIPLGWDEYSRDHPTFDDNPRITETRDGHPGDPLNVAMVGTQTELARIMTAARWFRADRLDIVNDLEIAADSVLGRADDQAPVSNLYLFGRRQDLAFEQPVGDSPRRRNHVRFWRTGGQAADGRPLWIGAASYDERVGLSHTTGQVTHHIAPDVDTERDRLAADLIATGELSQNYRLPGFHKELEGVNGGGDRWHTDGALWVGVIALH